MALCSMSEQLLQTVVPNALGNSPQAPTFQFLDLAVWNGYFYAQFADQYHYHVRESGVDQPVLLLGVMAAMKSFAHNIFLG